MRAFTVMRRHNPKRKKLVSCQMTETRAFLLRFEEMSNVVVFVFKRKCCYYFPICGYVGGNIDEIDEVIFRLGDTA